MLDSWLLGSPSLFLFTVLYLISIIVPSASSGWRFNLQLRAPHVLHLSSFLSFVFESSSVDLRNISLSTAFLTAIPLPPMLADACAAALLAFVTPAPMLANA